jgi:ubiquinone/menaquinone biosynthesis C-methylase UbiE
MSFEPGNPETSDCDYYEANRRLWNSRTSLHIDSKFYDMAGFRAGKSSLCGIELVEMGPIAGKSLLHLQCHFGQDTISLARHGAQVTGVDFSETAIQAAKILAEELQMPAEFLCHNIYDLPDQLNGQFDIVFTSFGTIGWLHDIQQWARLIFRLLKPGGRFYMIEFHRFYHLFNETGLLIYPYFHSPIPDQEISDKTYADGLKHEPMAEYWWNHSMSDIIMALIQSELQIELFHEFPYSVYRLGDQMVETNSGKWVFPGIRDKIPYMFSIGASRPSTKRL